MSDGTSTKEADGSAKGASAKKDWYSDSLARGLQVIRAFTQETPRLRISEVASSTGLTRAAARRYLLTLRELGHVGQDGDLFYLRPRILDLGYAYLSASRIEQYVELLLKDVCDRTGGAAHFAVFDNNESLFVASLPSRRMMSFFITVGGRRPCYAGSLGQVLLAGLPEPLLANYFRAVDLTRFTQTTLTTEAALRQRIQAVRQQGYAVNNGEHIEGVVGVAVPVHSGTGDVIAAVNFNRYSVTPLNQEEIDKEVGVLREAAKQIEARVRSTGSLRGYADLWFD